MRIAKLLIIGLLFTSCARNVLVDMRTCQKIDGTYKGLCKETE